MLRERTGTTPAPLRKRRSIRLSVSRDAHARPSLDTPEQLETSEKNRQRRKQKRRIADDAVKSLRHLVRLDPSCTDWVAPALQGMLPGLTGGSGESGHMRYVAVRTAAARRRKRAFSAARALRQLQSCHTAFLGYRSTCCGTGRAIPIVCKNRICAQCAHIRAAGYGSKVAKLIEQMDNPQMLTLTVPNLRHLTRESYGDIRRALKAFLKRNNPLLRGGVYSVETTYNRKERTWHPHIHVVVDCADYRRRLPREEFIERKRQLEFDWLVLTQDEEAEKQWRFREYREWLVTPGAARRVIDLRNIDRRNIRKSAAEVVKYITKAADFSNVPHAVAAFLSAVHGVRCLQTFGCWYNAQLSDDAPVSKRLECDCGKQEWQGIGYVFGKAVLEPVDGKWGIDLALLDRIHRRTRGPCRAMIRGG